MVKNKGRYFVDSDQISKLKRHLLDQNYRKSLLVIQKIEHEQYIGDSERTSKEDLANFRMVI